MGDRIDMRSREKLLLQENEELRARLAEAEQALQAIRSGEVDALIIDGPQGEQVSFAHRGGAHLPGHSRNDERGRPDRLWRRHDSILQQTICRSRARSHARVGRPENFRLHRRQSSRAISGVAAADEDGAFAPADSAAISRRQQHPRAVLGYFFNNRIRSLHLHGCDRSDRNGSICGLYTVPAGTPGRTSRITRKGCSRASRSSCALFENSTNAVFLTNTDGLIRAANPAACTMLGYSEEELCRIARDNVLDTQDPRLSGGLDERKRFGRIQGWELTAIPQGREAVPRRSRFGYRSRQTETIVCANA